VSDVVFGGHHGGSDFGAFGGDYGTFFFGGFGFADGLD